MDNREPPPELPAELKAFLYSCIDEVEQVEILALLCRSDRAATAHAVAVDLGLSDHVARHHLETLVARGLLQIAIGAEVSYGYAPKSVQLRRYAELLTEYYATSRTAILRFITTSPRRAKRFSDAFKLRDPE
jgi:predicted ArsR family transcriptional regulator